MQVTKDYIKRNIQEAAGRLFLEKGYPNVSMREIAETAQVGLSNIYNYFKNKDEIFEQVVQPALSAFDELLVSPPDAPLSDGGTAADFGHGMVGRYLSLTGGCRREARLLLFHADGSAWQNFKEDFTKRMTARLKTDLRPLPGDDAAAAGDFSLHLHAVWLFTLFEEVLKCDAPDEELKAKIGEFVHFERLWLQR